MNEEVSEHPEANIQLPDRILSPGAKVPGGLVTKSALDKGCAL